MKVLRAERDWTQARLASELEVSRQRALEDPEVSALVTRIGAKGGSLAPQNVCNWTSYAELLETFRNLADASDVHAVVVTGSGGNFCSGGDVHEFV